MGEFLFVFWGFKIFFSLESLIQPLTLVMQNGYEGTWAPAILTLRKSHTQMQIQCSQALASTFG